MTEEQELNTTYTHSGPILLESLALSIFFIEDFFSQMGIVLMEELMQRATAALAIHEVTEKDNLTSQDTSSVPNDTHHSVEDDEHFKQNGVRRLEALTALWTKQILVVM